MEFWVAFETRECLKKDFVKYLLRRKIVIVYVRILKAELLGTTIGRNMAKFYQESKVKSSEEILT